MYDYRLTLYTYDGPDYHAKHVELAHRDFQARSAFQAPDAAEPILREMLAEVGPQEHGVHAEVDLIHQGAIDGFVCSMHTGREHSE